MAQGCPMSWIGLTDPSPMVDLGHTVPIPGSALHAAPTLAALGSKLHMNLVPASAGPAMVAVYSAGLGLVEADATCSMLKTGWQGTTCSADLRLGDMQGVHPGPCSWGHLVTCHMDQLRLWGSSRGWVTGLHGPD